MNATLVPIEDSIEAPDNFEDNPKLETLIDHIRGGHFDPAVLFHKERWYTKTPILKRGDVVQRLDKRPPSKIQECILEVQMQSNQICYITNKGGPFAFNLFTLVRPADDASMALVKKCEDEENDW
jgi:hypothetical protein